MHPKERTADKREALELRLIELLVAGSEILIAIGQEHLKHKREHSKLVQAGKLLPNGNPAPEGWGVDPRTAVSPA